VTGKTLGTPALVVCLNKTQNTITYGKFAILSLV
jgi:hypothetical protein